MVSTSEWCTTVTHLPPIMWARFLNKFKADVKSVLVRMR